MPSKKITELDAVTTPADADLLVIVQNSSGLTKKIALSDFVKIVPRQYVDRGDPASSDFTEASLTTDGAAHDLDFSAIVPAGAYAALVKIQVRDGLLNQAVYLRKKGNSNWWNSVQSITQVDNIFNQNEGIVFLDANRKCEYLASNTTFTNIYITVRGWYI